MMTTLITRSVRRYFPRAAASEGGAQQWVRGCAFILYVLSTPVFAEPLPSGQSVTLHEVLLDTVGDEAWVRFRFLAPAIAPGAQQLAFDLAQGDMTHLCENLVQDYLATERLEADKIAVSLMDRIVPFGVSDPDATQFIEVYSIENGRCIWEVF